LYSGGPRRKGDEESGPSGAAGGRRHHRTLRDANADLNAGKKRKISKSADEIRSMVKEVNVLHFSIRGFGFLTIHPGK
jgi:hypothetical protein